MTTILILLRIVVNTVLVAWRTNLEGFR